MWTWNCSEQIKTKTISDSQLFQNTWIIKQLSYCSEKIEKNMDLSHIHLAVFTIFLKTIKLGKKKPYNQFKLHICREISHSSFWIKVQWLETHPVLCVIKIRALVTFYLPWQQRLQKKLIIKQKSLGYYCCAAAVVWEKILANFWLGSYFSDTIKEAN